MSREKTYLNGYLLYIYLAWGRNLTYSHIGSKLSIMLGRIKGRESNEIIIEEQKSHKKKYWQGRIKFSNNQGSVLGVYQFTKFQFRLIKMNLLPAMCQCWVLRLRAETAPTCKELAVDKGIWTE